MDIDQPFTKKASDFVVRRISTSSFNELIAINVFTLNSFMSRNTTPVRHPLLKTPFCLKKEVLDHL